MKQRVVCRLEAGNIEQVCEGDNPAEYALVLSRIALEGSTPNTPAAERDKAGALRAIKRALKNL